MNLHRFDDRQQASWSTERKGRATNSTKGEKQKEQKAEREA
jgi:hypothetical protein